MIKRIHLSWLIAGDMLVLAGMTVLGFADHGELGSAGLRLLSTFIPFTIAWVLLGLHVGVFDLHRAADPRQLWRPFWTMVLAAPLGAWLRGVWLSQPIIPIFVVVVGGVNALALFAWRGLVYLLVRRGDQ
jgi:hypothetical protein